MGVSVLIPVIREDRAKDCISSVRDNAGIEDYEIITEVDTERIGCPKMLKRLVEKSRYENVCFLGDDTIMEKDCLKNAMLGMSMLPDGWGLVGLNDGIHGSGLATHWVASKKLLPLLDGEFFNTEYWHCWCDNELTQRCNEAGRYIWAESACIQHNHPIKDKAFDDPDYRRVYSCKYRAHDMMLYRKRSNNGWKTP